MEDANEEYQYTDHKSSHVWSFSMEWAEKWQIVPFRMHLACLKSDKFRIYFLQNKEEVPDNSFSVIQNQVPFISFWLKKDSHSSHIAGMYLPNHMRWKGYSWVFFSQFIKFMNFSDISLGKTTEIRKPIFGKMLEKWWFEWENNNVIVNIEDIDSEGVPQVSVVEDHGKTIVNRSKLKWNIFFQISNTATWGMMNRVAVQTKYILTHPEMLELQQQKSQQSVVKSRIYKTRSNALLFAWK